jgi:DNA-binding NarL/FixJ family response regulator
VTGPVRVLIVDDDALVRAGLTMMLGGTDAVEVVEAGDGGEVLGAIDRHRPDVVLLDLRMPRIDGLEAMALVQTQPSPLAILVLTTFDTDDHLLRALRSGAAGFLVKDTPPAEIVRAIELVAAGESVLSPTVTRLLIDRPAGDGDADARGREAASGSPGCQCATATSPERSRRGSPSPRSPVSCT